MLAHFPEFMTPLPPLVGSGYYIGLCSKSALRGNPLPPPLRRRCLWMAPYLLHKIKGTSHKGPIYSSSTSFFPGNRFNSNVPTALFQSHPALLVAVLPPFLCNPCCHKHQGKKTRQKMSHNVMYACT